MADENPPQHENEQSAAPAMRARHRPPKSQEARDRGLAARKLQRQLEAVKRSKSVEKMEQAAAELARLNGEAAEREVPEAPRAEEAQQSQAAPPKELTAVPAHLDATKAGMPSATALADAAPTVAELVSIAAVFLSGTRFDILKPISVRVGDKVLERTKADVLAEKLTPLAAKYGMSLLDSPEALAVAGLVTVFGQPLMEVALEKLQAPKAASAPGAA